MSNVYRHAIEALSNAQTKMRHTLWDRKLETDDPIVETDRCDLLRFIADLNEEFREELGGDA